MSKVVKTIVGVGLIAIGVAVPGMQALVMVGGSLIASSAFSGKSAGRAKEASEMTLALGEQPRCALFGIACVEGEFKG